MKANIFNYLIMLILFHVTAFSVADTIDTSGQAPYEQCGYCHEYDGNSRMPSFPRIAGQKSAYIVKQLRDYRSGKRTGQMTATAELLNDDDIFAVANYFSQQVIANTTTNSQSANEITVAETLFYKGDPDRGLQSCVSCHGDTGQGNGPIPRLAGQHESYLLDQISMFKSGTRNNDVSDQMQQVSRLLKKHEIQALVSFLAKLESK